MGYQYQSSNTLGPKLAIKPFSHFIIKKIKNAFNDFCLHPVKNVYKSEEDRSALLGDIKRTYSCKKDLEYRMSTL